MNAFELWFKTEMQGIQPELKAYCEQSWNAALEAARLEIQSEVLDRLMGDSLSMTIGRRLQTDWKPPPGTIGYTKEG